MRSGSGATCSGLGQRGTGCGDSEGAHCAPSLKDLRRNAFFAPRSSPISVSPSHSVTIPPIGDSSVVGGLCQVDNCGGETSTYGVSEGQSCQQTAVNGTRSVFHGLLDVNPSPEDPGWLSCPCSILDLRARLGPAEEHSSAAGG